MIVGCVAQGLPSTVVRALFWSSVKGLLLTFGVGILVRFLRSPAREPVPFFVGVGAVSVLGSSIYKMLQSSNIAYFRRNSPFGYLGYMVGSQCGLVLLGVGLCDPDQNRASLTKKEEGIDLRKSFNLLHKNSKALIKVALILFCVFIAGGGIYDLVDKPSALVVVPWTGQISSVHCDRGEQTLSESLSSMFFYLCMISGLIVSSKSSRVKDDQRKANLMLVAGMALVILGLAGCYHLIFLRRIVQR